MRGCEEPERCGVDHSHRTRWLARLALVLAVGWLVTFTTTPSPIAAASEPQPAASTQLQLTPRADASVSARAPSKNMGDAPTLRSRADPTMRAYLRFSIPDPGGSITGAALRLRAAGDTAGTAIRGSGVRWTESAVTYRNAPQLREILGKLGGASAQDWSGVDVSEWVPRSGDTQVSFVVTSRQARTASFHSRETGSSAPQLILTIQPDGPDPQPGFPIRAAFYYGWFPETWGNGSQLYSNFHPSLGRYESADPSTARAHIQAMRGADIDAGIASWWGPGTNTDDRFPVLLDQSAGTRSAGASTTNARQRQSECRPDPSDLDYLRNDYADDPSALRVNGDFVVFVYADPGDGCGMAGRWANADTRGIFVVLKLFHGYKDCTPKPDDWHQYAPANAVADHRPYSYSVSPGFWKVGESPRLVRNLNRWSNDVDAMVASGARWQLVTTFNEWGEGTAVESADEWSSSSGRGHYLDVLAGADSPAPSSPPPSSPPSPSPSPSPPTPSGSAPVIAAAGDIACDPSSGSFNGGLGTSSSCHMKATSDLLVAGISTRCSPLATSSTRMGRSRSSTRPMPSPGGAGPGRHASRTRQS